MSNQARAVILLTSFRLGIEQIALQLLNQTFFNIVIYHYIVIQKSVETGLYCAVNQFK